MLVLLPFYIAINISTPFLLYIILYIDMYEYGVVSRGMTWTWSHTRPICNRL